MDLIEPVAYTFVIEPEDICPTIPPAYALPSVDVDTAYTLPSLAKQFTTEQLEQIRKGEARIKGYTWHHDAECGKMQLVKSDVHMLNRHTGGKAIWGGGRN